VFQANRFATRAICTTRYATEMGRREEWRKVLDSEVQRWSAIPCEQLIAELHDLQAYEVELDSKKYQVEVQLLENTDKYVHVLVAVDDGSLPASISPSTHSFICSKPSKTA
jgi:hypothetical protein